MRIKSAIISSSYPGFLGLEKASYKWSDLIFLQSDRNVSVLLFFGWIKVGDTPYDITTFLGSTSF